ncbi:MAG: DMT family transporter [Chloroflexia bacterium]
MVTLLALRAAIGSLFIWSLLPLVGRRMERGGPALAPRRRLGFMGLGMLTVFNSLTYFLALSRLPVSIAVLCLYLFPALTVLWSALFFGEHLNRHRVGALVLALGGAALTLNPTTLFTAGATLSTAGVAFALISAFGNSWCGPVAVRVGRGFYGYTVARHALPPPPPASCSTWSSAATSRATWRRAAGHLRHRRRADQGLRAALPDRHPRPHRPEFGRDHHRRQAGHGHRAQRHRPLQAADPLQSPRRREHRRQHRPAPRARAGRIEKR